MRKTRADVPGVITGTVLTGASAIWVLNEYGVLQTHDLGLAGALLLVAAGIVGLGAARRD